MYSATKCTASAREEKWERYRHSVFKLPKKISITASAQRLYDACHDLPITLQVENAELLGMDNGCSDDRTLWENAARETWRRLAYAVLRALRQAGRAKARINAPGLETVKVKIALCRCEMDGQAINSGSCWQTLFALLIQALGNNITGPAARRQKKHRRVAGHLSFARTGNR